jgi:hypothetical protein
MIHLMHKHNGERCRKSTSSLDGVVWLMIAALAFSDVSLAHQPAPSTTTLGSDPSLRDRTTINVKDEPEVQATAAERDPTAAPSPVAVMSAYTFIMNALAEWQQLPPQPVIDVNSVADFKSICGAYVQIRLDGNVIGRGTRVTLDGPISPDASYTYIRDAFNDAFKQADRVLPISNDALRHQNARTLASRMSVSLDTAGGAVPISPETWAEVALQSNPGATGYLLRVGDSGPVLGIFPSAMISTNTLPHRGLSGLVAESLGEGGAAAALDEPKKLREERRVHMYRFNSTHLAQGQAGMVPVFLIRGTKPIYGHAVPLSHIRMSADSAAAHLMVRMEKAGADAPMLGALRPWLAEPTTGRASDSEFALALYALDGYTRTPHVAPGVVEKARARADTGFDQLTKKLSSAQPMFEDAALAAWVMVLDARLPALAANQDGLTRGVVVGAAKEELKKVYSPASGFDPKVPTAIRGLIAYAWALHAGRTGSSEDRAIAESCVRRLFGDTKSNQLVGQLPWLGFAEIALGDLPPPDAKAPRELPASVALRDVRDAVWSHQFNQTDAQGSTMDFFGSIIFTSPGGTPLPTWLTARPVAYLARATRDDRLTEPKESMLETSRVLSAIRFLRQLQVDENGVWDCPVPALALGAVHASPWDHTLPADATSLALITFSEALTTFDALDVDGTKRAALENEQNPAPAQPPKPAPKP